MSGRSGADNVEIACTPTNSSRLNRIEARFTVSRWVALDGTGHAERASMIRRGISWRHRNTDTLDQTRSFTG